MHFEVPASTYKGAGRVPAGQNRCLYIIFEKARCHGRWPVVVQGLTEKRRLLRAQRLHRIKHNGAACRNETGEKGSESEDRGRRN